MQESAWSNKKERTAFVQMVDYAKRHPEVKHIIFDITDRMTRNDFDKIKIIDLIQNFDKTVHFSRSNKVYDKNSGSDDIFMLDIEVAVAKKMSNDISRKSLGMLEKAEQGFYPSTAPFGYRNNKVTRLIEVEPEDALFIKTVLLNGIRANELHCLEKNNIDLKRMRIPIKAKENFIPKTAERMIPIHPKPLVSILKNRLTNSPCLIFPNQEVKL